MSKLYTVVQLNRHVYWAMIVGLLFFGNAAQATAGQPLFESFKSIIVIYPGHGGQESGAKGPDGTLEKTVTLELARLIASELEPEFKVVLTRTDDYQVDLDNRTSLANHLKADIFISIHTAQPAPRSIFIRIFRNLIPTRGSLHHPPIKHVTNLFFGKMFKADIFQKAGRWPAQSMTVLSASPLPKAG